MVQAERTVRRDTRQVAGVSEFKTLYPSAFVHVCRARRGRGGRHEHGCGVGNMQLCDTIVRSPMEAQPETKRVLKYPTSMLLECHAVHKAWVGPIGGFLFFRSVYYFHFTINSFLRIVDSGCVATVMEGPQSAVYLTNQ